MKKIILNLYFVGYNSIFNKILNVKNYKDFIIENSILGIKSILSKNMINLGKDNFNFGLFLFSNFLQNQMFKNSIKDFYKNSAEFFDPMTFTSNIQNYLTNKICEGLSIRGYSNSYICVDFLTSLLEFKNSNCEYGIFINISKKVITNIEIIIFSKKEFTFLIKHCIMDSEQIFENITKKYSIRNNAFNFFKIYNQNVHSEKKNILKFDDIIFELEHKVMERA
ncbi:MAG TPA: hypothetical protein PK771_04365 [Spirochaetota bacterium]|nr:hypothetical protein [Spirochaetota bacterium]